MTPKPARTAPGSTPNRSIAAFIKAIEKLPSDEPVVTPGKWYRTQKEHWLGWLREYDGPGYYGRLPSTRRSARLAYTRIGEPKMLLWLIDAAGLGVHLPAAARTPRQTSGDMRKQAALIRERVPWAVVARALGLPADD